VQPAEQNCTERMIPVKPSDFVQPAEQNCTERMIPVKPSDFVQPAEQNCTEVGGRFLNPLPPQNTQQTLPSWAANLFLN